jgi:hypothetical protein
LGVDGLEVCVVLEFTVFGEWDGPYRSSVLRAKKAASPLQLIRTLPSSSGLLPGGVAGWFAAVAAVFPRDPWN